MFKKYLDIFKFNTLYESIIIGFITLIIGRIIYNFVKDETDKTDQEIAIFNTKLNIILFLSGILLHYCIELIGLNSWYCDKQCFTNLKNLAKL